MTETLQLSEKPDTKTDTSEQKLARTVRVMERLHAEEIFGTPESAKAFLDSLQYEEFKKWCDMVNGMERSITVPERGKASESVVHSEGALTGTSIEYQPPLKQFREELLKKTFEKAQSIDNPEVAGLTLGMAINAIHYYDDGNGRTGRMLYALLAKGYDGSAESKKYYSDLLGNTSGREVVNPNPETSGLGNTIRDELWQLAYEQNGYDSKRAPHYVVGGYDAFAGEESLENLMAKEGMSDSARHRLHFVLHDEKFSPVALCATFTSDEIEPFLKQRDGHSFVNGDAFIPRLDEEQIERLFKTSALAKRTYVNRIINFSDRDDADEIVEYYRTK